jgi:hypothetical protein
VTSRVLETEARATLFRITIAFAALNPLTAAALPELELELGTTITYLRDILGDTTPTNRRPQGYLITIAEMSTTSTPKSTMPEQN